MEFDEGGLALGVDQAVGVHPKAFHEAQGPRDRAVGHDPQQHVDALGRERHEVPEVVVGGLGLRKGPVRRLLGGVDQIGELDGVLDEEHRDVVAHQIPVALLGVELHGEAAYVARQVDGALVAGNRGETHEQRGLFACALEDVRASDVAERFVGLEVPVGPIAACMDHAFRDALVIEVKDLLAHHLVFEQRRAAGTRAQRILIVGNRRALLRGHPLDALARRLMQLSAGADGGVRMGEFLGH